MLIQTFLINFLEDPFIFGIQNQTQIQHTGKFIFSTVHDLRIQNDYYFPTSGIVAIKCFSVSFVQCVVKMENAVGIFYIT